jgi:hypothetical protein
MTTTAYGSSTVKRQRRTNADLDALDAALHEAAQEAQPTSVRHLFYVMTTKPVGVPKTESGYRCVQRRLLGLRRAGVIPYDWISDNTRWRVKPESDRSMDAALRRTQSFYRRDLWIEQSGYVEVWCESDSVAGVISSVTHEWDVPLLAVHGFSSESFLYDCADELADVGKPCFLYFFGDYDPSGLDIPRTVEAGLRRFAPQAEIHFERVAVTPVQIDAWNLPGRPPKATDSRSRGFEGSCVEIEAIPAAQLREMVRDCITRHIDFRTWERAKAIEREERESLRQVLDLWGRWQEAGS